MLNKENLYRDVDESTMAVPAKTVSLKLDSHGDRMFGRIMLPALETEAERAPVAVMLHGFPGLEQNMDMPPALRRGGIATLYFSYRGVWGSHGYYCFSHLIEDTFTVVNWIREHAEVYRLDPERIYLIAHSMGGFTALNAIAQGVRVRGAVVMAPCDMALRYEEEPEIFKRRMQETAPEGYFCLPHEDYLYEDMATHYHQWRFNAIADRIPQVMQLHFIGATQDEAVPPEVHTKPIYDLLRARGMDVSYQEFDTGHIFTSCRIALTDTVFDLIAKMERR